MFTEIVTGLRAKLTAEKANFDIIAKDSGVSLRTLYYVEDGSVMPTIPIIDKLTKYFERTASGIASDVPRDTRRLRERRARSRNRHAITQ